jgi:AcrR family transcriptional regulator
VQAAPTAAGDAGGAIIGGMDPAVPAAARSRSPAARTRDRAATEERILAAVGEVLARDGFGGIGINPIARAAGVDKVLIYRYFGGLPELLRAWGASGRFWPRVSDLLGPDPQALLSLPTHERYARFFAHFIDELRRRPITLAVMAAEIEQRNELTAILETERELWGEEAGRVLGREAFAGSPHALPITLLLVAGVQYLLLRARRIRIFGGIDIQHDAGWDSLKASIAALARQMFPPPAGPERSAPPANDART